MYSHDQQTPVICGILNSAPSLVLLPLSRLLCILFYLFPHYIHSLKFKLVLYRTRQKKSKKESKKKKKKS